jgi:hypothetical protein
VGFRRKVEYDISRMEEVQLPDVIVNDTNSVTVWREEVQPGRICPLVYDDDVMASRE